MNGHSVALNEKNTSERLSAIKILTDLLFFFFF